MDFQAKQIRTTTALIANLPGTLKIQCPEEHIGDISDKKRQRHRREKSRCFVCKMARCQTSALPISMAISSTKILGDGGQIVQAEEIGLQRIHWGMENKQLH